MQDHWLYIGETEARAALRATKCCTDQSNCCTATPLPQLLSHLLWTSSRHSRPVGDASLPLLQQDLSFALSAAGRSIPDMQQSCQVTLAGSDLGEGHSLSELMPLGGAVGMCTHTHRRPQTFQERCLVSHPSSSRAASYASSIQQEWDKPCPDSPSPLNAHPSAGAGSTCHHNKPDGEGARHEMLTGKFLPSSVCRAWLALQSPTVYSPYKNIYIEAACSMHIRPMASDLGRPQCHIQAQYWNSWASQWA